MRWTLIDELIDRFGEPPEAVKGLVDVALVQYGVAHGNQGDLQRGDAVLLYPEVMDMSRAGSLAAKLARPRDGERGHKPYITVKTARRCSIPSAKRSSSNDAARRGGTFLLAQESTQRRALKGTPRPPWKIPQPSLAEQTKLSRAYS